MFGYGIRKFLPSIVISLVDNANNIKVQTNIEIMILMKRFLNSPTCSIIGLVCSLITI